MKANDWWGWRKEEFNEAWAQEKKGKEKRAEFEVIPMGEKNKATEDL